MRFGCRRFTAHPNLQWQSYFMHSPRNGDICEMFWGRAQQGIYEQLERIVKGEAQ